MILVDTHIWLWFLTRDSKLKGHLKETMVHRPSEILLASISVVEAGYLAGRGLIDLGDRPLFHLRQEVDRSDFVSAPLDNEIALLSHELPLLLSDPADRILAATAKAYDVPLATFDEKLRALSWLKTIQ